MRDYICLNNQKVMLTKKQVAEIRKVFNNHTTLGDVPVGDTFTVGELEFVVLEHSKETTAVILNGLIYNEPFGCSNCFRGARIFGLCDLFAHELSMLFEPMDALVEHTVNLTTADGLKDYGEVKTFASLLTIDLYRRYVDILDKYKVGDWWLATAYSAPTHGNTNWVNVVTSSGCVANFSCYKSFGVRPFCILRSDTIVSM